MDILNWTSRVVRRVFSFKDFVMYHYRDKWAKQDDQTRVDKMITFRFMAMI